MKQLKNLGAGIVYLCVGLSLTLMSGCGGGGGGSVAAPAAPASSVGTISGGVVKGPVAGAQVHAFAINANGAKDSAIGTATTSSTGSFTMTVGSHAGPVMLEMTGGTFVDEASGNQMGFSNGDMMTAVVPFMTAGATIVNVEITPLTSMAQTMAAGMTGGMSQANAATANTAVGNFYGVADILQTRPMDPSLNGMGATATVDQRNYGLCLAAMSQYAATLGLANTTALVTGLMGDAADGIMNGMSGGTGMMLDQNMMGGGGMTMSATAGYAGMATAMQTFLNSAMNHSGITAATMQTMIQQLSSANGHML